MLKKSDVIGINAGHAVYGSRGAKGYMDEVIMNRRLKKWVIKRLRSKGYNTVDISIGSGCTAGEVLTKIVKKAEKKGTNVNVSIHLNAGGGDGIEIYPPTHKEDLNAYRMTRSICEKVGFKNRGVKEAGKWFVNRKLKKCYLFEIGFVDSRLDYYIYKEKGCKKIGYIIADAIIEHI